MRSPDRLEALATAWREQAGSYAADGLAAPAAILRRVADELEAHVQAEATEVVTLKEAAAVSGYSVEHLRRLIRTGELRNAATDGGYGLLRRDVPRKAVRPDTDVPRFQLLRGEQHGQT